MNLAFVIMSNLCSGQSIKEAAEGGIRGVLFKKASLVFDGFIALYAAKLFDSLDATYSKLKGMAIT